MHSSKASVLKTIIFCIVLVLCSCLMTYLLCPLSSMNQKFITYHKFSQNKNIDFLVLGNSLEGNGLNADIISKEMNLIAYVFSPQGSYPESLYYLLVDVAHTHNVKNLVVGWDIIQNFQSPAYVYPHKEELYREFLADLQGNRELQQITFKNIMKQRFTSSFFEWSSFPENILEIPAVLESKKTGLVEPPHVSRPISVSELETYSSFNYHKVIDNEYITAVQETDVEYIKKIRDYCNKHKINLLFISNPIPDCISTKIPLLHECIEVSADLMKSLGITYLNTSNQQYFPCSTIDSNFKDCFGHIIPPYTDLYTKQLCDWIKTNYEPEFK